MFKSLAGVLILFFSINSFAQLQKVDSSFILNGAAGSVVRNIHTQSSGKIILTGEFNAYQGTLANRVARLNTNGIVDTSFKTGQGSEGPVRASAVLPNDKVVIGGLFNSFNNIARKNIARLNADGRLDTSFAKGAGANNEITDILVQKDGKLLITGFFSKYNNVNFNGFLRLTTDGEIDTTFKIGTGTNLSPNSFAQQSDQKIILVGNFISYNGTPRNKIVRVNLDGSLDTSFINNTVSNTIQKILVLDNDELIISGGFTNIAGVTKTGIARLKKDGQLDTAYKAYVLGTIRSLHLQKDGKVIIAGDIYNVNGQVVQKLARLNIDGSLDNTFYAGFNGSIYDIAEQVDRKILLGGVFTQTTNVPSGTVSTNRIVRLLNYYCLEGTKPVLNISNATACENEEVHLTIQSGKLNDARTWYLFADSCDGIPIDSGSHFHVSSSTSKSFYVRASPVCVSDLTKCTKFDLNVISINSNIFIDSLKIISLDSGANLQWYSCDSIWQILPGETNSYFVPQSSGYYSLVIERDGCVDTSDCVSFKVLNLGINKGTQKLNLPNPIKNEIVFPVSMKYIEIISSLGQVVYKNSTEKSRIAIQDISQGIYIIRCIDLNNNYYFDRMIIQ